MYAQLLGFIEWKKCFPFLLVTVVFNDRTKPHLFKKLRKMGHCCKSWLFWTSCKLLLNAFGVWTPQSSAPFQRLRIPITFFLERTQIPQCVLLNVCFLLLTSNLSFMGLPNLAKSAQERKTTRRHKHERLTWHEFQVAHATQVLG